MSISLPSTRGIAIRKESDLSQLDNHSEFCIVAKDAGGIISKIHPILLMNCWFVLSGSEGLNIAHDAHLPLAAKYIPDSVVPKWASVLVVKESDQSRFAQDDSIDTQVISRNLAVFVGQSGGFVQVRYPDHILDGVAYDEAEQYSAAGNTKQGGLFFDEEAHPRETTKHSEPNVRGEMVEKRPGEFAPKDHPAVAEATPEPEGESGHNGLKTGQSARFGFSDVKVTGFDGDDVLFKHVDDEQESHAHRTEVLPPRHFAVTGAAEDEIQEKVDKLNKRRHKKGMAGQDFRIKTIEETFYVEHEYSSKGGDGWVPEHRVTERLEKNLTGKQRTRKLIEIEGDTPRYNGWEFAAKLTPLVNDDGTAAGNLVKAPEGAPAIPKDYRTQIGLCEHCNVKRRRNDTFVLKHEDGEFKCVGRQCLKDFLGFHGNPDELARAFSMYGELIDFASEVSERDEDGEVGYGGRGDAFFSLSGTWLPVTAASIRKDGFVPKKLDPDNNTTAAVLDYHTPPSKRAPQSAWDDWRELRERYKPNESDKQFADDAIEWIKDQDPQELNDYLFNLHLSANADQVNMKNMGLATSLLAAYARENDIELHGRMKKDVGPVLNEHVGEIGKRQVFSDLTVTMNKPFESSDHFGNPIWKALIKFKDPEGRQLVWFTESSDHIDDHYAPGTTHTIKGTPKKHDDYKDTKQTIINRVQSHVEPTKIDKKDIEKVSEKHWKYGKWNVNVAIEDESGVTYRLFTDDEDKALAHSTQKGNFDEKKALAKARQLLQKHGATK